MRLLLLLSILCLNSSLSFAIEKDISSKDNAELDRIFAELEQEDQHKIRERRAIEAYSKAIAQREREHHQHTKERSTYGSKSEEEFQIYAAKFHNLINNAIDLDMNQPFECRINIKLIPTKNGFIVQKVTMLYDNGHCKHIPEAIETLLFPMPKNRELVRQFKDINISLQNNKLLESEQPNH
ncbi:cell envelope integrity protein TolA [Vibrio parahaemolyticus]|uniref:cell envelope integrity protein TolA n=1 Tax=Vibrio TaxID=662 RepID=UPI002963FBDF|nr:cell envelope integrity protein TolA [Vibrio sp. Vb0587]MBE4779272.1 cell envelope integrity protein TolA [Vibrio parahaemolyticus]MDW1964127.1 cell envelope integrity protein TolA [Vibrio sp. Vb0587]